MADGDTSLVVGAWPHQPLKTIPSIVGEVGPLTYNLPREPSFTQLPEVAGGSWVMGNLPGQRLQDPCVNRQQGRVERNTGSSETRLLASTRGRDQILRLKKFPIPTKKRYSRQFSAGYGRSGMQTYLGWQCFMLRPKINCPEGARSFSNFL